MAFNRGVAFDEKRTLDVAMPYLRRQLGIEDIVVVPVSEAKADDPGYNAPIVEAAEPAKPGIVFYNTGA